MERVILHSDIDSCYASIELLYRPELRGTPVAVGGDEQSRHGIVLAKTPEAKRCGVKTGMALWEARARCPELTILPAHHGLYETYARQVRDIYRDYTDRCEPYGIDESWLDLTGCLGVTEGEAAAWEINRRVRRELGITVSLGVSWNKIFAKLGSDFRKPNGVTLICRDNYRQTVWPLPVEALLYVGPATSRELHRMGIGTIGELALSDERAIRLRLGINGETLRAFALGWDVSPVQEDGFEPEAKSVGNSTTTSRDMVCERDVSATLLALSETVGARLRAAGLRGRTVEVGARDASSLEWRIRQRKLPNPVSGTRELAATAMELFRELWRWPDALRSLSLRCSSLVGEDFPEQTDCFGVSLRRDRDRRLDAAVDGIRRRYGYGSIHRGGVMADAPTREISSLENHSTFSHMHRA